MQLYLFRLSLKERQQVDAFERAAPSGRPFNREMWLRDILSKEIEFRHRNSEFVFVPATHIPSGWPPHYLAGWIARQRLVDERKPPSEGLVVTEHASWQAALILVDPSDHEDGQKLAMEARADIGKPASVLASLFEVVNELGVEERFSTQIYPIIQSRTFKAFAERNRGALRKITYETAVPNMFTNTSDWDDDMRVLRDRGNVANVKTTLISDGALNLDDLPLDDIADHVERGGGKIAAENKDGEIYKTEDYEAHVEMDAGKEPPDSDGFWTKVGEFLDKIF